MTAQTRVRLIISVISTTPPTNMVRLSTMQGHLGRGKRARAQLIFEAVDAISVARAIFQRFRHEKQSKATRAGGRTLRASERQNQFGGDIGTEPFVPPEFPFRLKTRLRV